MDDGLAAVLVLTASALMFFDEPDSEIRVPG